MAYFLRPSGHREIGAGIHHILPPKDRVPGESHLSLQVYDAETLQKLPLKLTSADSGQTASDDETLILSDVP